LIHFLPVENCNLKKVEKLITGTASVS